MNFCLILTVKCGHAISIIQIPAALAFYDVVEQCKEYESCAYPVM